LSKAVFGRLKQIAAKSIHDRSLRMQPMANGGCQDDAAATEALFVDCFKDFDTIVGVDSPA
jgi:hypothetical protein